MLNYKIREIKKEEYGILEEILYQAVFVPEGAPQVPRSVLQEPRINIYIDGYGKNKSDICFVAESGGKIIGAVWTRILAGEIKGYGNVDGSTPEFAIALFKEYRKQGIGTALMKHMLGELKSRGFKQASLSVNKENYAFKMYLKLGFRVIEDNEEDYLMIKKFD